MTSTALQVKHIKAGSFRTRYLEAGTPGNPQLVLLHDGAFGATAELSWGAVMAELATDFHILAPDLLGWGGTDKAVFLDRSPYAGRLLHLQDFIDATGVGSPIYAGCSFGGSLVVRAAVAPQNPLRMRAGFSIAGTGGPYRAPEGIQALGAYKPTPEGARALTALLLETTSGQDDHIEGRLRESLRPGHWEAMAAPRLSSPDFPRTSPADSLLEDLRRLQLPLRLVEGTRDALMVRGWSAELAALSPRISRLVLESGHLPNVEAPRKIASLLRDFVSEIGGRS